MRLVPLLLAAACLVTANGLRAADASALPPEAQKIVDKADAAVAAATKTGDDQIAKLKTQEAKDLQRLHDAAVKKGDQALADTIKQRIDAIGAPPPKAAGAAGATAAVGPAFDWSTVAAGSLSWADATSDLGGGKWGAYGVHSMASVPGSEIIYAGISEIGLWASADGGGTWKKLGEKDSHQIAGRPIQFVFDPVKPSTFWIVCSYGDALFRSDDGGVSFVALGNLKHADGLGVDFTDPERRTLLMGMHEQSRSLQLSTDGGKSWSKIGDKLPEKTNFTDSPLVLDGKTFLTNTSGWGQGLTTGIWRTEDAGQTWTQVSPVGPSGKPTIAADGTIYWQAPLWGKGMVRSKDKGKTWEKFAGTPRVRPVEVDQGTIASASDNQLLLSKDGGQTWTPFGPNIPGKVDGVIYNAKRRSFFAYHLGDKGANTIMRLEVKAP